MSLAVRAAGVGAAAALVLAACGSNNSSGGGSGSGSSGGTVSLDPQGSTFQQTLEQQWASQFHQSDPSVQVTYTGTGSSTGIQQFTEGKIPFAGSDVTMAASEQQAANSACGSTALTIPVTAGGVAIIYNVKGVTNLKLTAVTLAKIFEHKITKWNDPEIAAENPGVSLPAENISVFYRQDGSGTTSVTAGFLDATAGSVWNLKLSEDKTLNWPAGQGATGSDGVTQGVKQTEGGITYAEVSYAKQDNLPTAAIKGAKGGFVNISGPSVAKSIQSGFTITGSGNDLAGSLSFTKMTGYPISTVSYVLVCSKYSDSKVGAAVKKYLTYAIGAGQQQAEPLGFAPLPSSLVSKDSQSIASIS